MTTTVKSIIYALTLVLSGRLILQRIALEIQFAQLNYILSCDKCSNLLRIMSFKSANLWRLTYTLCNYKGSGEGPLGANKYASKPVGPFVTSSASSRQAQ